MHFGTVLAALAMSACGAVPDKAGMGPDHAPGIEGRYIVAAIDGAPPVINIEGHSPTITIGGDRVHFQSQCIYADWTLRRQGGAVSATPYYEPGSAMCARGLAPGETAIEEAFDRLETIELAADGGLSVAGGGHRLELRRAR